MKERLGRPKVSFSFFLSFFFLSFFRLDSLQPLRLFFSLRFSNTFYDLVQTSSQIEIVSTRSVDGWAEMKMGGQDG